MTVTCATCHYFTTVETSADWGVCHRHAPRAAFTTLEDRKSLVVTWPLVHAECWCGEFKKAAARPKGAPRG